MKVRTIVISYFKHHPWILLLSLLMVLAASGVALIPAQLLRIAVDDGIVNQNQALVLSLSLCYGGCYLLSGMLQFLKNYVILYAGQSITRDIRREMMRHYYRLGYSDTVASDSGHLESYFGNDVESISELFSSGVMDMLTDSVKIIGILITIFIYSYIFGFILLAVLPFVFLFTQVVRKGMLKAQLKTKGYLSDVNHSITESSENMESIHIYHREAYMVKSYNQVLQSHYQASQKTNFYDGIFSPVMHIIRDGMIVTILLVSGYHPSLFGMTAGMIVSAIGLLTDIFSPIEAIGMEIQTIQKSMASVRRINSFLSTPLEEKKEAFVPDTYEIKLSGVSYSYDGRVNVIENRTMDIPYGTRLVLKGESGVGKSTLLKLCMGLLQPKSGSVTIGGIPLFSLSSLARGQLFSIVYQDPFFSGESVYDEIALHDVGITEGMVEEVLSRIGLSTDIHKKLIPEEYSSGELALFGIARVLVRKTPVIFLDEMNSRIDPVTARHLMEILDKETKGRTVISITHYGTEMSDTKECILTHNMI